MPAGRYSSSEGGRAIATEIPIALVRETAMQKIRLSIEKNWLPGLDSNQRPFD